MNKKFALAVVAYFVITMAMGAFTRGEPIMLFGMTAIVLQAIVFAYFYPLFFRHVGGGNPVRFAWDRFSIHPVFLRRRSNWARIR